MCPSQDWFGPTHDWLLRWCTLELSYKREIAKSKLTAVASFEKLTFQP